MHEGSLISATPEFLRWVRSIPDLAPIQINQAGTVIGIGQFSTIVAFGADSRVAVPHWMAREMAAHDRDLQQCSQLIRGYRRAGGWR